MNTFLNGLFIKTYGDKNKQPIIFIHGFPFDNNLWENQVKVLKEDYFCITYDVRGLGKSETCDGQFTMEVFADDLIVLTNELQLDKPVLCGMSMGGYISLRTVEKSQDSFGGIILIDTKSGADNDSVKLKRAEGIEKINKKGVKIFNKDFITPLFWEKTLKTDPKLAEKIIRRADKNQPIGVKGALLAMVSRTDTSEFLKKINIPALVLCGKYDGLTTPEVMKNMADNIPDSEFYVVPKAGHMTPVENPEFVNKKIEKFMMTRIK